MLITGTKTITKEEWKLVEIALEKIRTIEIKKKKELIRRIKMDY